VPLGHPDRGKTRAPPGLKAGHRNDFAPSSGATLDRFDSHGFPGVVEAAHTELSLGLGWMSLPARAWQASRFWALPDIQLPQHRAGLSPGRQPCCWVFPVAGTEASQPAGSDRAKRLQPATARLQQLIPHPAQGRSSRPVAWQAGPPRSGNWASKVESTAENHPDSLQRRSGDL